MPIQWIVSATLLAIMMLAPGKVFGVSIHDGRNDCASGLRQYDPLIHKPLYKIGVHATSDTETAMRELNLTFDKYLTATAGKCTEVPHSRTWRLRRRSLTKCHVFFHFPLNSQGSDSNHLSSSRWKQLWPPFLTGWITSKKPEWISFTRTAVCFPVLGWKWVQWRLPQRSHMEKWGVYLTIWMSMQVCLTDSDDWLSCRLSELQPSSVSKFVTRVLLSWSNEGVIFTRADRTDINRIADIANKTVAALAIDNFAQGVVQFYVMKMAGLDITLDPQRVTFTGTQFPTLIQLLKVTLHGQSQRDRFT